MVASVGAIALAGSGTSSGLKPGEFTPAYEPHHSTGPDKGTETCPVCKYGQLPIVQVWVNGDSAENVVSLARSLEGRLDKVGLKKLRVFFTFVEPEGKSAAAFGKELVALAARARVKQVAFTHLSATSVPVKDYKINLAAKNTIFVQKKMKVKATFVDLKADNAGLAQLSAAVSGIL